MSRSTEDMETPYDVEDLVAFVQEGDFLPIKNAIISGAFSARITDQDGCSLLHWAAINNRIQIAKFLIKNGAECVAGGILGETPLHWALRKKYYSMAQILHEQLHLDMSIKSKQGLDALNLVIRLGDMNAVFMLLTWGANPNAEDAHGISPLLWLMQNNNTTKGFEMSKILIQFGAKVTCVEPRTKNTLMHFLALNKKFDLIQAFYLYQNNPSFFRLATNAASQGVYKLATMSENRKMAKFLLDVTLFHALPSWTPTVVVSALWFLYYFLLYLQGFLYGTFFWLTITLTVLWAVGQHYIIPHRDRLFVGSYLGFASIILVCFLSYISDIVSVWTRLLFVTLVCATAYCGLLVHRTRPQVAPRDMQVDLTQRIIDAAPSEGTDEENQELMDLSQQQQQMKNNTDSHTNSNHNHNPQVRLAVVKDAFTGRVSIVRQRIVSADFDNNHNSTNVYINSPKHPYNNSSNTSNSSSHHQETIVRLRSLGPRLCGHCLTDKRCIELLPNKNGKNKNKNNNSSNNSLSSSSHDYSDKNGENSNENVPKTAIAIATHCVYCQLCILDQDHHCTYLHACIARGNRRSFVFFQWSLFFTCIVFFFSARFLLFDTLCDPFLLTQLQTLIALKGTPKISLWSLSVIWKVETCVWSRYAHFAFAMYLSLFVALYSGMVAYIQCVLVMKETTLHNLVKNRAPLLDAQRRSQMINNLWSFLQTGRYTVVYPRNLQLTNTANSTSSSSAAAANSTTSANSSTGGSSSSGTVMNNREDNTTGGVRSMLSALSATVKNNNNSSSSNAGTHNPNTTTTTSAASSANNSNSSSGGGGGVVGRIWQRLEEDSAVKSKSEYPRDEDDQEDTPLLYYAEPNNNGQQGPHSHRKRNGSFTTSEPPPAATVQKKASLSSGNHGKEKLKKSVSFASQNQYQSPPTSSTKAPSSTSVSTVVAGMNVMTQMPPKFPAVNANTSEFLEEGKLYDVDYRGDGHENVREEDSTSKGLRARDEYGDVQDDEDEESETYSGVEFEEEDDYDPEFVESELNGYLGSGRSLKDEEEMRLFELQEKEFQRQRSHDHSHDHGHSHSHGHHDDEESGKAGHSAKKATPPSIGVDSFQRQTWVR